MVFTTRIFVFYFLPLVLAMYYAASVLVDGVANAWGAFQHREKDGWWLMLLIGIAGVLVGGYALLNPPVSIGAFVFLVAFMAIWLGAMLISLGYKVRKATEKEWLLYLGGALSVLFGVTIILQPVAGSLSVVWLIATWAVIVGALRIGFAFRVKNLPERIGDRLASRATA